jgi:hypothetical protein
MRALRQSLYEDALIREQPHKLNQRKSLLLGEHELLINK